MRIGHGRLDYGQEDGMSAVNARKSMAWNIGSVRVGENNHMIKEKDLLLCKLQIV